MKYYVGHPLQTRGAEHYKLQGGKGDGMNFLCVRNGIGLEVWISLDRCADPGRVNYRGFNMGYMSPCGNVAPAFYDDKDDGFLKSFTAGFMTTCGFQGVGTPSVDEGEKVPFHGTVGNLPAELKCIEETDEGIVIKAEVRDCVIFGRRFVLRRVYKISYTDNVMEIKDTVTNEGEAVHPFLLLYHCNMGYPLLSENSIVKIPYSEIRATPEAIDHIDTALVMEKPQQGFVERCYFFDPIPVEGDTVKISIYNPDIKAGMEMSYNRKELPCFTEWKMMGRRDYVLGLEPGNCKPCPRAKMREKGLLKFLAPDKSFSASLTFRFTEEEV